MTLPAWMDYASCADHPNPDLWFPGVGISEEASEAKRICQVCPVIKECARYGAKEQIGIWGGMGYRQRRQLKHLEELRWL